MEYHRANEVCQGEERKRGRGRRLCFGSWNIRSLVERDGPLETAAVSGRVVEDKKYTGSSTGPTRMSLLKAFSTFTGSGTASGVVLPLSLRFLFGDHVTFVAVAQQDRTGQVHVCVRVCGCLFGRYGVDSFL